MAVAKRKTLLDHIIDSFKDLTLGILICAAFLSIILGFSLDNQDDWIQVRPICCPACVFILAFIQNYMFRSARADVTLSIRVLSLLPTHRVSPFCWPSWWCLV